MEKFYNDETKLLLSLDEWRTYYEHHIDKKEYADFEDWELDMTRMGLLAKCNVVAEFHMDIPYNHVNEDIAIYAEDGGYYSIVYKENGESISGDWKDLAEDFAEKYKGKNLYDFLDKPAKNCFHAWELKFATNDEA